jgi:hypothetical protein
MEDDMAVDAVGWLIFAIGIAFIGFGCRLTEETRRPAQSSVNTRDSHRVDRAA